jgi:Etoposide-induced protein 2.4 (EI24)
MMVALWDAFWRAVGYCLHPRVLLWSLLPLLLAAGGLLALGWLYWESSVAALRGALEQWQVWATLMDWLDSFGAQKLHALLAPLILVMLAVPLVVMATLALVALFMTPAVVSLVAARRFPQLERRRGAGWAQQLLWSLSCTLAALVALVLSLPLWLVPPLVLILPPLIWGWLTCRVLAFDVLAAHASRDERRLLLKTHRLPLLAMGVITGYLGAAPSVLFAFGAVSVVLAPVLGLAAVWIYTVVFAFAACWFAHYLLAALQRLRQTQPPLVEVLAIDEPPAQREAA